MKSKYTYKQPSQDRYVVSIRKWNNTFAYRGRWPLIQAEVYLLESGGAIIHYTISPIGKVLFTLILPIVFIVGVCVGGIPDTVSAIKDVYWDKQRGAFGTDGVSKSGRDYEKLMKLIGRDV